MAENSTAYQQPLTNLPTSTSNLQCQIKKRNRQKAFNLALILILGTIWGLAVVFIRRTNFELSPVNLTLLRWLIASAILLVFLPFTIAKQKIKLQRRDLVRLLAVALFSVPLYHLLLNFGEATVTSGVTGFLTSIGRIFIALLSAFLLKEKISRHLVLAIIIAVAGAFILAVPNFSSPSHGLLIGSLEVIFAALSFAVFAVLSKPLLQKYGSLRVMVWSVLMGTIMLLPLLSPSLISEAAALSLGGWFFVLYLAIFSSVVGYLIFYTLINRESVTRLSIQLYLVPVISVTGGILLLHESVTLSMVVGGLFLLLSVTLVTVMGRSKNRVDHNQQVTN